MREVSNCTQHEACELVGISPETGDPVRVPANKQPSRNRRPLIRFSPNFATRKQLAPICYQAWARRFKVERWRALMCPVRIFNQFQNPRLARRERKGLDAWI